MQFNLVSIKNQRLDFIGCVLRTPIHTHEKTNYIISDIFDNNFTDSCRKIRETERCRSGLNPHASPLVLPIKYKCKLA